jgi:hypothetical protein
MVPPEPYAIIGPTPTFALGLGWAQAGVGDGHEQGISQAGTTAQQHRRAGGGGGGKDN